MAWWWKIIRECMQKAKNIVVEFVRRIYFFCIEKFTGKNTWDNDTLQVVFQPVKYRVSLRIAKKYMAIKTRKNPNWLWAIFLVLCLFLKIINEANKGGFGFWIIFKKKSTLHLPFFFSDVSSNLHVIFLNLKKWEYQKTRSTGLWL